MRSLLVLLAAGLSLVLAHGNTRYFPRAERQRRQLEANERHVLARRCSSQFANFHSQRSIARKRATSSPTLTAASPHYTEIQNFTCVTAPETSEGPFYVNNEYVRTDLVETQRGVKLLLDIGVLDTTNCEPLPGAFVELWSANATGFYGAFEQVNLGGPNVIDSIPMTSHNTFLRGGYPTNKMGIVKFNTIYPGFYHGRTAHIHVMVHTNWTSAPNGTLLSHSGSVRHVGQVFFEEDWNDKVFALPQYRENRNKRIYNDQDSGFEEENADGNNAQVQLELQGEHITDGLVGYITIGVNTSALYHIHSTNYHSSGSGLIVEALQY